MQSLTMPDFDTLMKKINIMDEARNQCAAM
jgi:hypothetical protein